jgi:hypothetical protein
MAWPRVGLARRMGLAWRRLARRLGLAQAGLASCRMGLATGSSSRWYRDGIGCGDESSVGMGYGLGRRWLGSGLGGRLGPRLARRLGWLGSWLGSGLGWWLGMATGLACRRFLVSAVSSTYQSVIRKIALRFSEKITPQ